MTQCIKLTEGRMAQATQTDFMSEILSQKDVSDLKKENQQIKSAYTVLQKSMQIELLKKDQEIAVLKRQLKRMVTNIQNFTSSVVLEVDDSLTEETNAQDVGKHLNSVDELQQKLSESENTDLACEAITDKNHHADSDSGTSSAESISQDQSSNSRDNVNNSQKNDSMAKSPVSNSFDSVDKYKETTFNIEEKPDYKCDKHHSQIITKLKDETDVNSNDTLNNDIQVQDDEIGRETDSYPIDLESSTELVINSSVCSENHFKENSIDQAVQSLDQNRFSDDRVSDGNVSKSERSKEDITMDVCDGQEKGIYIVNDEVENENLTEGDKESLVKDLDKSNYAGKSKSSSNKVAKCLTEDLKTNRNIDKDQAKRLSEKSTDHHNNNLHELKPTNDSDKSKDIQNKKDKESNSDPVLYSEKDQELEHHKNKHSKAKHNAKKVAKDSINDKCKPNRDKSKVKKEKPGKKKIASERRKSRDTGDRRKSESSDSKTEKTSEIKCKLRDTGDRRKSESSESKTEKTSEIEGKLKDIGDRRKSESSESKTEKTSEIKCKLTDNKHNSEQAHLFDKTVSQECASDNRENVQTNLPQDEVTGKNEHIEKKQDLMSCVLACKSAVESDSNEIKNIDYAVSNDALSNVSELISTVGDKECAYSSSQDNTFCVDSVKDKEDNDGFMTQGLSDIQKRLAARAREGSAAFNSDAALPGAFGKRKRKSISSDGDSDFDDAIVSAIKKARQESEKLESTSELTDKSLQYNMQPKENRPQEFQAVTNDSKMSVIDKAMKHSTKFYYQVLKKKCTGQPMIPSVTNNEQQLVKSYLSVAKSKATLSRISLQEYEQRQKHILKAKEEGSYQDKLAKAMAASSRISLSNNYRKKGQSVSEITENEQVMMEISESTKNVKVKENVAPTEKTENNIHVIATNKGIEPDKIENEEFPSSVEKKETNTISSKGKLSFDLSVIDSGLSSFITHMTGGKNFAKTSKSSNAGEMSGESNVTGSAKISKTSNVGEIIGDSNAKVTGFSKISKGSNFGEMSGEIDAKLTMSSSKPKRELIKEKLIVADPIETGQKTNKIMTPNKEIVKESDHIRKLVKVKSVGQASSKISLGEYKLRSESHQKENQAPSEKKNPELSKPEKSSSALLTQKTYNPKDALEKSTSSAKQYGKATESGTAGDVMKLIGISQRPTSPEITTCFSKIEMIKKAQDNVGNLLTQLDVPTFSIDKVRDDPLKKAAMLENNVTYLLDSLVNVQNLFLTKSSLCSPVKKVQNMKSPREVVGKNLLSSFKISKGALRDQKATGESAKFKRDPRLQSHSAKQFVDPNNVPALQKNEKNVKPSVSHNQSQPHVKSSTEHNKYSKMNSKIRDPRPLARKMQEEAAIKKKNIDSKKVGNVMSFIGNVIATQKQLPKYYPVPPPMQPNLPHFIPIQPPMYPVLDTCQQEQTDTDESAPEMPPILQNIMSDFENYCDGLIPEDASDDPDEIKKEFYESMDYLHSMRQQNPDDENLKQAMDALHEMMVVRLAAAMQKKEALEKLEKEMECVQSEHCLVESSKDDLHSNKHGNNRTLSDKPKKRDRTSTTNVIHESLLLQSKENESDKNPKTFVIPPPNACEIGDTNDSILWNMALEDEQTSPMALNNSNQSCMDESRDSIYGDIVMPKINISDMDITDVDDADRTEEKNILKTDKKIVIETDEKIVLETEKKIECDQEINKDMLTVAKKNMAEIPIIEKENDQTVQKLCNTEVEKHNSLPKESFLTTDEKSCHRVQTEITEKSEKMSERTRKCRSVGKYDKIKPVSRSKHKIKVESTNKSRNSSKEATVKYKEKIKEKKKNSSKHSSDSNKMIKADKQDIVMKIESKSVDEMIVLPGENIKEYVAHGSNFNENATDSSKSKDIPDEKDQSCEVKNDNASSSDTHKTEIQDQKVFEQFKNSETFKDQSCEVKNDNTSNTDTHNKVLKDEKLLEQVINSESLRNETCEDKNESFYIHNAIKNVDAELVSDGQNELLANVTMDEKVDVKVRVVKAECVNMKSQIQLKVQETSHENSLLEHDLYLSDASCSVSMSCHKPNVTSNETEVNLINQAEDDKICDKKDNPLTSTPVGDKSSPKSTVKDESLQHVNIEDNVNDVEHLSGKEESKNNEEMESGTRVDSPPHNILDKEDDATDGPPCLFSPLKSFKALLSPSKLQSAMYSPSSKGSTVFDGDRDVQTDADEHKLSPPKPVFCLNSPVKSEDKENVDKFNLDNHLACDKSDVEKLLIDDNKVYDNVETNSEMDHTSNHAEQKLSECRETSPHIDSKMETISSVDIGMSHDAISLLPGDDSFDDKDKFTGNESYDVRNENSNSASKSMSCASNDGKNNKKAHESDDDSSVVHSDAESDYGDSDNGDHNTSDMSCSDHEYDRDSKEDKNEDDDNGCHDQQSDSAEEGEITDSDSECDEPNQVKSEENEMVKKDCTEKGKSQGKSGAFDLRNKLKTKQSRSGRTSERSHQTEHTGERKKVKERCREDRNRRPRATSRTSREDIRLSKSDNIMSPRETERSSRRNVNRGIRSKFRDETHNTNKDRNRRAIPRSRERVRPRRRSIEHDLVQRDTKSVRSGRDDRRSIRLSSRSRSRERIGKPRNRDMSNRTPQRHGRNKRSESTERTHRSSKSVERDLGGRIDKTPAHSSKSRCDKEIDSTPNRHNARHQRNRTSKSKDDESARGGAKRKRSPGDEMKRKR